MVVRMKEKEHHKKHEMHEKGKKHKKHEMHEKEHHHKAKKPKGK